MKNHRLVKVTLTTHYLIPNYIFGPEAPEVLMKEWFVDFVNRAHVTKDWCHVDGSNEILKIEDVDDIRFEKDKRK